MPKRFMLEFVPGMYVFVYLIIQIQEGVACPNTSYTLSDGTVCYWVTSTAADQVNSSTKCESQDGFLAVIPNQQISDELNKKQLFTERTVWIGVNDIVNEGVFKNYDDSPVTWTNWGPRQPNDPNIASLASEDCVHIQDDFKWFDDSCGNAKIALCSKYVYIRTSRPPPPTSQPPPTTTAATTTIKTTTTTTTSTATEQESTSSSASFSRSPSTGNISETVSTDKSTNTAAAAHNSTIANVMTSKMVKTTITTQIIKTTTSKLQLQRAENTEKILVPVVIVVVLIVGATIAVLIVVLRRKRHPQSQPKDGNIDTYSATSNPQYNTIDVEKNPADNLYGKTKDSEYDILNQNRRKVLDDQPLNLYDHTNVQDNTYDVTDHDNRTANTKTYDNGKRNTETKQTPKEYNSVIPAVDNNEVYYSSTKDPFDTAENAYGDVPEGEYDILHKKRNTPNNTTDQIYSHTADDMYDTTNNGRKVDDIGDTYDSTMHGDINIQDDTYDSTLPENRSRNVNNTDNTYDSTSPVNTTVYRAEDTYNTTVF